MRNVLILIAMVAALLLPSSTAVAQQQPVVQWQANLGRPNANETGTEIVVDPYGNMLVVGYSDDSLQQQGDLITIWKYNPNRELVYEKQYQLPGYPHCELQIGDTIFIFAHSPHSLSDDVLVLAFSQQRGETLWTGYFGDSLSYEIPKSACFLDSETILITYEYGLYENQRIGLMAIGLDGALFWKRTYDIWNIARPVEVLPRGDGTYWIVANTDDRGDMDIAALVVSGCGELLSIYCFGSDSLDQANGAFIDGWCNLVILGCTADNNVDPTFWVINPSGQLVYQERISYMTEGAFTDGRRIPGTGCMLFGYQRALPPDIGYQVTATLLREDLSREAAVTFGNAGADDIVAGIYGPGPDGAIYAVGTTNVNSSLDIYACGVGVELGIQEETPGAIKISNVWPSIVRAGTLIYIKSSANSIVVRDVIGRVVRHLTVLHGTSCWDGRNDQGNLVNSGSYFIGTDKALIR